MKKNDVLRSIRSGRFAVVANEDPFEIVTYTGGFYKRFFSKPERWRVVTLEDCKSFNEQVAFHTIKSIAKY